MHNKMSILRIFRMQITFACECPCYSSLDTCIFVVQIYSAFNLYLLYFFELCDRSTLTYILNTKK